MKKNYVNKTTFTKAFYQKIARFNSTYGSGFYVLTVFITMFTYIGFTNISDPEKRLFGIFGLVFAILAIPVFCYVLPMLNGKKNYEAMLKGNDGNEMTVTTEFSDKIKTINSTVYKYDQIKEIREFKGLTAIIFKDDQVIYLDNDGFVSCSKDDVLEHLVKYSKVVPKK